MIKSERNQLKIERRIGKSRLGRKRKYYRYIQIYDFCAVSKKKVILQIKNGFKYLNYVTILTIITNILIHD